MDKFYSRLDTAEKEINKLKCVCRNHIKFSTEREQDGKIFEKLKDIKDKMRVFGKYLNRHFFHEKNKGNK